MTFKVKVLGAGSIGNHLSNAARALGWSVDLCDIDAKALERARTQIYPARYGNGTRASACSTAAQAPHGGYDLIFIGTPPHVAHSACAARRSPKSPEALLIEKPLCGPDLSRARRSLHERARRAGVAVFVGYDHVVGRAARLAASSHRHGRSGRRDDAWTSSFASTGAGSLPRIPGWPGRGKAISASGSAAAAPPANIRMPPTCGSTLRTSLGAGRVVEVQATLDIVKDDRVDYDRLCLMTSAHREAGWSAAACRTSSRNRRASGRESRARTAASNGTAAASRASTW